MKDHIFINLKRINQLEFVSDYSKIRNLINYFLNFLLDNTFLLFTASKEKSYKIIINNFHRFLFEKN